jgi:alpha-ketoglutarate-dependent 2,4-dichlorophenoxyacetate dioxygenase
MPGRTNELGFEHISVKELHPTFGAEITGVDFSGPVSGPVFEEILAAITKVR